MLSRRQFALAAGASAVAPSLPRSAAAMAPVLPGDGWRRFEITSRLDLDAVAGPVQAWIPLPAFEQPAWIRSEGHRWSAGSNAVLQRDTSSGADLLHVRWGEGPCFAEATSTVVTRDRMAALAGAKPDIALADADRAFYLRGSALAPTDGLVRDLADRITAGKTGEIDTVRALYEWVVENTFRSAPVRGCGDGDILRLLRSGTLGGKCADLNPLFVALARASGIPGRDLYGIRVAPSRLGYRSLGPSSATITKSQHCRAEVFLNGVGWTAMDPADVRKIMLEEPPGGLTLDDPKVAAARARLFGAWEGNWVPFNAVNDLALPGASGRTLGFLMYPQIETAAGLLDCYDPEKVRYSITARELAI